MKSFQNNHGTVRNSDGYPAIMMRTSARERINVRTLPMPLDHVWGGPSRPVKKAYRSFGKRAFDVAIVLLSLPFTLFIIAICALALWIEGGNPFYRQQRLGFDGKSFSILKLRTMVRNADEVLESHLESCPKVRSEWNELQKLRVDPRVTRLGAFMRSTSIDELPQLWNVLTGEMSIVGPRPMMPEQLEMYGNPDAYFALRPGITGYWQISARNDNGFAHRNAVDATYEQELSLSKDVAVMFKTVGVMARRTGC